MADKEDYSDEVFSADVFGIPFLINWDNHSDDPSLIGFHVIGAGMEFKIKKEADDSLNETWIVYEGHDIPDHIVQEVGYQIELRDSGMEE